MASLQAVTRLAVVAYPVLPAADRDWIEVVRARYDPQAFRIKAHFTLVFPVELPVESLVGEVRAVLGRLKPIQVVLRRCVACRDALGDGGHVFLLPQEGRRELLTLHDQLYEGELRSFLRADVPFEPHVTVGACRTLDECERIAEDLRQADRTLPGTVHGVEVVDVSTGTVRTVMEVPFGDALAPETDLGHGR